MGHYCRSEPLPERPHAAQEWGWANGYAWRREFRIPRSWPGERGWCVSWPAALCRSIATCHDPLAAAVGGTAVVAQTTSSASISSLASWGCSPVGQTPGELRRRPRSSKTRLSSVSASTEAWGAPSCMPAHAPWSSIQLATTMTTPGVTSTWTTSTPPLRSPYCRRTRRPYRQCQR